MAVKNFPKEASNYKNEWVALSSDETKVVGHGKTPAEALDEAKKAGEERPILIFIPKIWPQTLVL